MKKKLSILLVLALLFGVVPPLRAQAAGNQIKRIGLSYKTKSSDTTVASAGLNNKTGWGYSLGYYDDQRQFVSLGWTQESKVNVLITQNLYLTSSGGYSYTAGNHGAVGCFHVQWPGAYSDFSSAKAAADAVDGGFVAWVNGTYYVRSGSYTGRSAAQAAADAIEGATMGETSGYGYSVVPAGSTKIIFQFDADQAGETGALGVLPLGPEGEKAVTVYNGGQSYYGGFRFERINGGQSTVVNMIELEDYIKGVVPYEMSPSWPLEALKAQAVCARTYAGCSPRHGDSHFDLCSTVCCQAYKGTSGAGAASDQAVEETAGVMAYYKGKRIEALYYSSNGGASEDNKNVNGYEYGYLKGKIDPYEEYAVQFMSKSQLSYYQWTKTWTATELKKKLNDKGYACGEIVNLTTKLSEFGNVIAVTITDANGTNYTYDRSNIRSFFNLNSIRFTITPSGGDTQSGGYAIAGAANAPSLAGLYAIAGDGSVSALPGESYVVTENGVQALVPAAGQVSSAGGEKVFTFNGTGWGHNVGMSQWGAYAMAKQGYTYRDILTFYYTDITIQ